MSWKESPSAAIALEQPETAPENRDSLWRRLVHGTRRTHQRDDWSHFAGDDWPERIMHMEVTDRFHAKQGRSTGRWIAERDGRRLGVYLKRHYRLGWWRGLMAWLRPGRGWSPAFEERRNLQWARDAGFPVPDAVAASETIGPWFRLQSMLAVEELAGMLPLHEAIPLAEQRLSPQDFRRWKIGLVAELARLARKLHVGRMYHKDLYLCHFYIDERDTASLPQWENRVFMIDLHRLKRHRWTGWFWQAKDLAQFWYSSDISGVTKSDRVRFWKLYTNGEAAGWLRRCMEALIRWKVRQYHRHNQKRKERREIANQ